MSAGGFFYVQMPGLPGFFLVLSGLTDGRVARLGTGWTPWGGALDLVCDRIVEAAILLGIALPYSHLHAPALVLAATRYENLCDSMAVGAVSNSSCAPRTSLHCIRKQLRHALDRRAFTLVTNGFD